MSDRTRFPFAEGTLWFTSDNLIVQDLDGQRNLIEGGNIHAGYLMNNNFYVSSTYATEYAKDEGYLYIDLNDNGGLYIWDGENFRPSSPEATENVAGIMKLYQTAGSDTRGTISQKGITDGIRAIQFAVDSEEPDCLVLDLPWD